METGVAYTPALVYPDRDGAPFVDPDGNTKIALAFPEKSDADMRPVLVRQPTRGRASASLRWSVIALYLSSISVRSSEPASIMFLFVAISSVL